MEPASHEAVGVWVAIFYGTLLGAFSLVWLARQIWVSFNPPASPREGPNEYVTRHELSEALSELKASIKELVGRPEYTLRAAELQKEIEIVKNYLHERMHDLINSLGSIGIKVDCVVKMQEREEGRRQALRELRVKTNLPEVPDDIP